MLADGYATEQMPGSGPSIKVQILFCPRILISKTELRIFALGNNKPAEKYEMDILSPSKHSKCSYLPPK